MRIFSDQVGGSVIPNNGEVQIAGRCRKCEVCKRKRKAEWVDRCMIEKAKARYVWFATLTFSDEFHESVEDRYDQRLQVLRTNAKGKVTDWCWKNPENADECAAFLGRYTAETQKYWKRIRKAGGRFRYMGTMELHKSGRPHFHFLIFVRGEDYRKRKGRFVTHRTLKEKWPWLVSDFKLANQKEEIIYTCGYISYSPLTRVPCSLHFGAANGRPKKLSLAEEVSAFSKENGAVVYIQVSEGAGAETALEQPAR